MKKIIFKIYDRFTKNICKWRKLYSESKYWSKEQLKEYQLERLKELGINSWEEFYKLPLTTKEDLRNFKPDLSKYNKKELTCHYSSGSTGEPLKTYGPGFLQSIKPAIFERAWKGVGWNGKDYILRLTAGEPQWKVFDWLRNVKPMNYRTIGDKHINWIIKHKPFLIHGGSGAIREITTILKKTEEGLKVMKNIGLYLMSEDTTKHVKELKKYYRFIYSGYGLAELCTVASQCEFGLYYVNMETCIVEVIDGEIIVTDLFNNIMPIIRYRTKDYGYLHELNDYRCGWCDKHHDILLNIKGRGIDYYDGPEVKRPLGWWILSPISHNPKVIKQWKVTVIPKEKKLILYVVWKNKPSKLYSYKRWIKKETGLSVEIVEKKTMSIKQRMKLLEIVK